MSTFIQDIRFALRNLQRTPAFPLAAIATLALGIGATTAIFSTVNAVLLRPLPYPNPEDLYGLRTNLTDGRVTTGMLAQSEIYRLNDQKLSVVRAAGVQPQDITFLKSDGTPTHVVAYAVTEGFFEIFGLPMTLGSPAPQPEQAAPLVVISQRIWRDVFNSDPAIVGKPIRFAEFASTISGVAPRGFDTPHNADFWFQVQTVPQDVNHSFDGYMRLKPGTTQARAESEMAAVMSGLARDFPASAKARIYVVRPLVASIVGDLGPILIVVLSATTLLLVLACVNVTNLLLARGAARAREIAVRIALGAGRRRIVRQLMTESVLLAAAGALVGVLVAYAGVRGLQAIGAATLPRLDEVPFDGTVLWFALLALIVSALLVGFAPALRLAGTDVRALMNEGGRSASGGRGTARWLSAMTIAEIALAITLVAGAGWLIRGFDELRATDTGFATDRRLMFEMSLIGERYRDGAAVLAVSHDVIERMRQLPGVAAAGATSNFPLRGAQENSLFAEIKGQPVDPSRPNGTRQRFVSPGFFDAMGIKRVTGRDFNAEDKPDGPRVVLVNRVFVKRYLADKDPIGVHFTYGYPTVNPNNEAEIIGVVDDVRQKTLMDQPEPAFYSSLTQGTPRRQTVVVHTKSDDTAALQASIRDEMRRIDPQMAVDFRSLDDLVGSTIQRQELGMTLMLWFGVAAVALATVGIYGVIAYAAAQRRNEVATRLALGATPGNVFGLVLQQGRTLILIGAAIGLGLAYVAGRIVSARVYEVHASDPVILGGATLLVVVIAFTATMIPAIRAARLDPSRVLRPD